MIGYLCSVHCGCYYKFRPFETADSDGTASVSYSVICSNRNNFMGSLWTERETSVYVERENKHGQGGTR